VKKGLDLVERGLKSAKAKVSKPKYERLLSQVFAELLKQDPDIVSVKAYLAAVEESRAVSPRDLMRAKDFLDTITRYATEKRTAGRGRRIAGFGTPAILDKRLTRILRPGKKVAKKAAKRSVPKKVASRSAKRPAGGRGEPRSGARQPDGRLRRRAM